MTQHEPEPSVAARHTISTSSSPALTGDNPVAYAAKRKVPDLAPWDEEPRDCHPRHVANHSKGSGGVGENGRSMMWVDEDTGAKIRMETMTALKNSRRRSGGERARTACIDSDGESSPFFVLLHVALMIHRWSEADTLLERRRKIRGVPPPYVQLGSQGVDVDSAINSVTPARNDIDSPISYGFSLGITDEDAPIDKVSEKLGPPTLDEAAPPRERGQVGLGGVQGQSSRGRINKEKRCLSSMPERRACLSERGKVEMGEAVEVMSSIARHVLSPSLHGGASNLDDLPTLDLAGTHGSLDSPKQTSDSSMCAILDNSGTCSGVPSAPLLLPSSRLHKRRRAMSGENPQSRMKGKAKAKADESDFVDLDTSKEDIPLGRSCIPDLEF